MNIRLDNEKPKLRGLFANVASVVFGIKIPYEVRNESGDWSKYFGQWEGQKKGDLDTNCCWAFAGNEVLEDQLEFLMKTGAFTIEDIMWFHEKGYIDEDGDFYLSRRYIPILSGVKTDGNDEAEFWRITKNYGAIPNHLLPYTNFNEYFDLGDITQEMRQLGEQFLERVNIQSEEVGTRFTRKTLEMLKYELKQSELQIGIPVPADLDGYNNGRVRWDGRTQAQHSIALWKVDEEADYDFPIFTYDQYNPVIKQLSRDYFIPICTKAVVTPKNVPAPVPVTEPTPVTEPVPTPEPLPNPPLENSSFIAWVWRGIVAFFKRIFMK